jgi:putative thioredoxin
LGNCGLFVDWLWGFGDRRVKNRFKLGEWVARRQVFMGQEIVVNQENFATAVVAASHQQLVVVDFFATWCGPCQLLKPRLQGLLQEYDFVLATVDIDQNPELADEYGVEGVPDVRIVTGGKMIPGFVGVLEEAKIRELLDDLQLKSRLTDLIEQLQFHQRKGDLAQAKILLDQLFQAYPQHPRVAIAAAEFLIPLGKLEEALRFLNTVQPTDTENFVIAGNIRGKIMFIEMAAMPVNSELDQVYVTSAKQALLGDFETALGGFLSIVQGDRRYQDDGARKAMLVIFNLLGKNHPLTQKFQQQLMLALY